MTFSDLHQQAVEWLSNPLHYAMLYIGITRYLPVKTLNGFAWHPQPPGSHPALFSPTATPMGELEIAASWFSTRLDLLTEDATNGHREAPDCKPWRVVKTLWGE